MTPAECIAFLDEKLAQYGETVVLRRTVKRAGSPVDSDVDVRAAVRAVGAEQIAGTIIQTDLKLILSPTQITTASWPGANENVVVGDTTNQSLPDITDTVIVQGVSRQIKQARPFFVGGVWVRSELVVGG